MNVWLIKGGEPLPIDPGHPRLLRTGLLAEHLIKRGHAVTWWASSFRHSTKSHRFNIDKSLHLENGLRLILLHSPGYRRNISFRRFVDHILLAKHFRKLACREKPPDIIHCAFPTIELSEEAAMYGLRNRVPVVLDARDLWPDIFLDAFPGPFRWIGSCIFWTKFRQTRNAFRNATAISGHTAPFVEFGLRYAGRPAGALDRDFPLGYPSCTPSAEEIAQAHSFWNDLGIPANPAVPIFCYFGAFGAHKALDLFTPVEAARILERKGIRVLVVMCGRGPKLKECQRRAAGLKNVLLPGWVGFPEIWTLMRMSLGGLLPYSPARDFAMSIPNKAIEYLSASLPIITSLNQGYLHDKLQNEDCAYFYDCHHPEMLAEVFVEIMTQPDAHKRRAGRAGAVFSDRFSSDVVYSNMVDYLETIVRTHSQAPGPGHKERLSTP